eukprot:gnl/TRDRNA2_/TRDRNA2_156590_c0_seq2.p1 gnl/TRDRNA2_/TRDRNA2_156590_c0~~gnl/TRDRNA2_/TRDRNA2_156590_c0_seq2.p1  ORF type:complete len:257 (+),score=13.65 gnl/TRDRNA2_/TRDRNA2_156590_c0_seq2:68-838(+)
MFSSSNLVEWNHTCHFTLWNDRECPDLFELPVDGGAEGERRWVFFAGGGTYLVGQLRNDSCFEPLVDKESRRGRRAEWGNGWATQTFNDEPRGRVVQISWMMNCVYPKMRFNQQMSFPMELRLRDSPTGPYLVRRPVEELTLLRLPGRPLINISQSGLAQIGKANPARCFGHAFEFEVHVQSPCIEVPEDQNTKCTSMAGRLRYTLQRMVMHMSWYSRTRHLSNYLIWPEKPPWLVAHSWARTHIHSGLLSTEVLF